MIIALRGFFIVVLLSMLAVTSWASLRCPLFAVPKSVIAHPWFIATLFDAYWGFLTFYVWVFYQKTSWVARFLWLFAILLLGNIAMSAYCLAGLFRVPTTSSLAEVLSRRSARLGWLGPVLAALGLAILLLA